MPLPGIALRLVTLAVGLVGVALSAGCGADADGAIVMRLGHTATPGSPYNGAAQRFKQLVERRLADRVEVRVFPAAQLGGDREMLDGLRVGTLEMHLPSSVLHAIEPLLGVFELPFLIQDRGQFERVVQGPVGARIERRLAEHDLVLLAFWENGFRMITNNVRPIVSPEDLRGIKLRTPRDPARVRVFRAFGANPTSMDFGELFTALRQGVVDGQENPLSQIVSGRLYEVQEYLSISRHVYTPVYPIMSRRFFESLPEDVQAVIREAAREVGRHVRTIGEAQDAEYLAFCRQYLEVVEIDNAAFELRAEPLYEEFAAQFGQEMIDAIRRERARDGASQPSPPSHHRELGLGTLTKY